MDGTNALGEFLRARRGQVRPEDVGLPGSGPRRVPGLRREEVAMLSGISSDYYLRLEQGRDRNPSAQVLQAIARVLRLDTDTTSYLLGLAHDRPRDTRPGARTGPARHREQVPEGLLHLIDGWPRNPAYIQNRYTDCLAANALATALTPNYRPGVNLLRAVFLDPAERALRRDWDDLTEEGVAALRAYAGPESDDPRLRDLVGDLSLRSDRFRTLWARHEVRPRRGRLSRLSHPQVGDLDLYSEKLTADGTGGLTLVVFHADPGSRGAELLDILGSLAAPRSAAAPEPAEEP